jgi:hypothetical protein
VVAATAAALHELVDALRRTFDLDAVALLRTTDVSWAADASAGDAIPERVEDAQFAVEVADRRVLVLAGGKLADQDALLRAFITELRLSQGRAQLAEVRLSVCSR